MKFDVQDHPPPVSVCLITYNHAPYIRECLDSLLMQETSFPYEICVGEDESTDGTREICIEYAEKYPGRIRLFLRSQSEPGRENFLSQGVYNYIETTKACRGKYVALCDGDDAWIDSLKLQKQFDIMEANPGVSLVHSDYDKLDEVSGRRVNHLYKQHGSRHRMDPDPARFRYDLIRRDYPIAASTVFARTRDVLEIFEKNQNIFQSCPMGDIITWCELIDYGSFYFQDGVTSLYRIQPASDSNPASAERKFRFVNGAANLGLMLGEKYNLPMDRIRANKVRNSNRCALFSEDFSEINKLYADADYKFTLLEYCVYQAGRLRVSRAVVRKIFELRYRSNHRRFSRT